MEIRGHQVLGHYTQNLGKIKVLITFLGKRIFEIGERFHTFQGLISLETCLRGQKHHSLKNYGVSEFVHFPYILDFCPMVGSWTYEIFDLHEKI